jgi:GntR family transcriptional regulator
MYNMSNRLLLDKGKYGLRSLAQVLRNEIVKEIEAGTWRPEEKLPSEASLSETYGISRTTVREALSLLEDESLITKIPGLGAFVNRKVIIETGIERLESFTEMVTRMGMTPGVRDLSYKVSEPDPQVSEMLGLAPDEKIMEIGRVRTADGQPVEYCEDFLPVSLVALKDVPAASKSLFVYLETQCNVHISKAKTRVFPIKAKQKVASRLDCDPDFNLLLLKQLFFNSEGRPVFYSEAYYRPDEIVFTVIRS